MRRERLDHEYDIHSICRMSKDDSSVDFNVVVDDDDNNNGMLLTY